MDWAGMGPDEAMPIGLFEAVAGTGLFSLTVPREYGGLGASNEEFVEVIQTCSTIGACVAITAVPHLCNGVKSICLFAPEEMKKEVFKKVCEGRLISFALTEDHTGSNVPSIRSKIEKSGDGYLLKGSKLWVTNVPFACRIVVVAKSPDLSPIPNGSTFVLVDPQAEGLIISRKWSKLAADGSPTVDLYLDGIQVTEAQLFGDRGKAIAHFNKIVETGRLGAAAGAAGMAQKALALAQTDAEKYGHGTDSPPSLPVGEFDGFVSRAVLRYSGFLCDIDHEEHNITTALCKMTCTDRSMSMVQDIFSWYLTNGLPVHPEVERILKEIPFFKIVEGPTEVITYHAMLSLVTKIATETPEFSVRDRFKMDGSLESQLKHLGQELGAFARQISEMKPMIENQNALWALARFAAAIHTTQCVCAVTKADGHMDEGTARNYRKRSFDEAVRAHCILSETLNADDDRIHAIGACV
jgi:alkylation response protein AidB-like acyl-CoA dehydrogenase